MAQVREKLLRVLVADLGQVLCRKLAIQRLEPIASVLKLLVGVVNREEDSVDSNLVLYVLERQCRKVSRGGDPDVLVEVVTDGFFHRYGATRLVYCLFGRKGEIVSLCVSACCA